MMEENHRLTKIAFIICNFPLTNLADMGVILGVIFHFIGGFASGSFYMPFKKVKGWAWESYWIIGGLFSWLIVPPLAAWLTLPGFSDIIKGASSDSISIHHHFWCAVGNWWTHLWIRCPLPGNVVG